MFTKSACITIATKHYHPGSSPKFILTWGGPPCRLQRTPWSCITTYQDQGVRFTNVRPSTLAGFAFSYGPTTSQMQMRRPCVGASRGWDNSMGQQGQLSSRITSHTVSGNAAAESLGRALKVM